MTQLTAEFSQFDKTSTPYVTGFSTLEAFCLSKLNELIAEGKFHNLWTEVSDRYMPEDMGTSVSGESVGFYKTMEMFGQYFDVSVGVQLDGTTIQGVLVRVFPENHPAHIMYLTIWPDQEWLALSLLNKINDAAEKYCTH